MPRQKATQTAASTAFPPNSAITRFPASEHRPSSLATAPFVPTATRFLPEKIPRDEIPRDDKIPRDDEIPRDEIPEIPPDDEDPDIPPDDEDPEIPRGDECPEIPRSDECPATRDPAIAPSS
jgi:hypothetical protein